LGVAAVGTVSRSFTVPGDGLALRFAIHGGRSRVLLQEGDRSIYAVSAADSNEHYVPVSWDLVPHRGREVTLAIVDEEGAEGWGFIGVSGFDLVRAGESPLKNPLFEQGLVDWDATGDASQFNRFRDPNYGNVWSISTAPAAGERTGDAATGSLSQQFVVPADGSALRFVVHGGSRGRVVMSSHHRTICEVVGPDSNEVRVPASCDLRPVRGQEVTLAIEDTQATPSWAFITVSGFDLLTE
jgi:hypothetical protein